jgi:hypothetical protein
LFEIQVWDVIEAVNRAMIPRDDIAHMAPWFACERAVGKRKEERDLLPARILIC